MRKLVVCLAVLAVAVLFTSPADADNGLVSSAQLQAMGLAGMQVMTDAEAMSVRGKLLSGNTFRLPRQRPNNKKHKKPWTLAAGGSIAGIAGEHDGKGLIVGSANLFISDGKYFAGGASEADFSLTKSKTEEVMGPGGLAFSVTHSKTIAGATSGAVSSYAFGGKKKH